MPNIWDDNRAANIASVVVEFGQWQPVGDTLVLNPSSIATNQSIFGTGYDKKECIEKVWKEVQKSIGERAVSKQGDEWVCTDPLVLYERRNAMADMRSQKPIKEVLFERGKAKPVAGRSGFAEAVARVVKELGIRNSGPGRQ